MSKEAMKLALEAFREIAKIDWHDGLKGLDKPTDFAERQAAMFALGGAKIYALRVIKVLEEALAQPSQYAKGYADAMNWKTDNHLEHLSGKQEPVAWGDVKVRPDGKRYCRAVATTNQSNLGYSPLYTTPQRCSNCASLEAQNTELDAKLAEQEQGDPVAWSDEQMIQFASMVLIQGKHSDSIEMRLETFRGVMVERGTSHPPKQEHGEPVAWWVTGPDGEIDWSDEPIQYKEQRPLEELVDGCGYAPLYTTPQQRTWVGMTDEEIEMIVENKRAAHWEFIRQVEALLKEKNT